LPLRASATSCPSNATGTSACDLRADGFADDQEIQQAIDLVSTSNGGVGGTVLLSEGDFQIERTIAIDSPGFLIDGGMDGCDHDEEGFLILTHRRR
jgi:hypothetical protein